MPDQAEARYGGERIAAGLVAAGNQPRVRWKIAREPGEEVLVLRVVSQRAPAAAVGMGADHKLDLRMGARVIHRRGDPFLLGRERASRLRLIGDLVDAGGVEHPERAIGVEPEARAHAL